MSVEKKSESKIKENDSVTNDSVKNKFFKVLNKVLNLVRKGEEK